VLGKIINPQLQVERATEIIASTIETIVGALIGFIGGRAVGRNEANGGK
jgi:hypothetical protein